MLLEERVPESIGVEPGASPPPRRRPYWPIALLMLGLVLALLGAAFILSERYRVRVGVEPSQLTELPTQVAALNAPQASLAPTTVAVATPVPTMAPTAMSVAEARSSIPPTSVPSVAANVGALPAGSAVPSAAELITPLQRELIDAYLRYWDVRMRAYYDLDASRLREVMAGAELTRETQQVLDLRTQGRAISMDVEHNIRVLKATSDEAVIYDEYVNHSLYMDPATKRESPTKETPPIEKISYQFKKVDGVWKVVDGTRHV